MSTFQPSFGDAARLSGTVKWFNRSKGFGFVIPSDGTGDVFLPLAVLERSGFNEAPDGATVVFDCVEGPKGRAVSQVIELDASTAAARPPREGRFRGREESATTEALDGVVKWYDPARGFGFVLPNDGGKDVFVHITALRRSGLEGLEPGQPVRMKVAVARRGREAAEIELLP
jgi:CspA family cold shock protein